MISFQQVSRSFGTQDVIEDASFTVNPRERVGIVGPNGAGKSTIFELLIGGVDPQQGEISIPSDWRIGYVRQQLKPYRTDIRVLAYAEEGEPAVQRLEAEIRQVEAQLAALAEPERTQALRRIGELQTRFEHLGGYELRTRAEKALSGLGFSPEDFARPFASFSGGWQMRAELARTLVVHPDLLLLDEPTNYLDTVAIEWLRDYLRDFEGTLLLISHDRYLLNSLTDVTLEVTGTMVTRYAGNYEAYVRARDQRRQQALAAKKNQDRRREQVERFVERFRAKNTKASQVQSRVKMLEKIEEVRVPRELLQAPKIRLPAPPRCGAEVVRLDDVGFSYDGQRWVLRHADLRIERGDKAAVVGLNGMGKTTLLRILAGLVDPLEGKRLLGHKVSVGYQSQDFTDVMSPMLTVYETVRKAATGVSDSEVRNSLGGFRFSGDAIEKRVEVLSGGEKVRLALARILLMPHNFLILDEPTTHLDVASREALEAALRDYAGTLCIVSHDVEFLRHVATTIFAITPDGVRRFYGGYDYYREKLARELDVAAGDASAVTDAATGARDQRKAQKRQDARRRQELYRLRQPLEKRATTAEQKLDALEREQAQLVQQLAQGDARTDFQATNRRLSEIQAEIVTVTEEWEQAALLLEQLLEECKGSA